MNKVKLKNKLLEFTEKGVEKFLNENSNLEFYAFAFDCNAEYAEVNLCLNTENEFQRTLTYYQNGDYPQYYQSDEDIKDLKFNPGDWEYLCFESTNVLSNNELAEIFQSLPEDDDKSWKRFVQEIMELFCETLIEFRKTEIYRKIPKTDDFISFCIDHDEDFEPALERLKKLE